MDDVAGQAYVEQFGLETFQRADRAVKANKVTKYAPRLLFWLLEYRLTTTDKRQILF